MLRAEERGHGAAEQVPNAGLRDGSSRALPGTRAALTGRYSGDASPVKRGSKSVSSVASPLMREALVLPPSRLADRHCSPEWR